ncbi:phage portal protein [Enterococcus faecium]|nr:phage portal protein [Enterococcus faecium]
MRSYNPIDGKKPPKPFRFDKDKDITLDVVNEFMRKHQMRLERYKYLSDMYHNATDVFYLPNKEVYKPDNRLSVNYAKYITDTFTGYFNGIPVHKQHEDKKADELIRLFDDDNDIEDEESELVRLACIYGHAFEVVFQDEDAKTHVTYATPEECFIVYDNTIEMNPLFAVHYIMDDDNMSFVGTVWTKDREIEIKGNGGTATFVGNQPAIYPDIPVIEYMLNDSRTGIFEGVSSLINAMNKAISEKANDVDYFADAYLAITGMEVTKEDVEKIRDNRVINAYGNDNAKVDVRFLDKPDSDSTQENLLDRLHKLIFQISMVADISDENFGAVSGVALEHKYQAMNNLAHAFDRKFQSALRRRYMLLFSLETNISSDGMEAYKQIEYTFKRNMPIDYLTQAQAAVATSSLTSTETALKILDIVQDVKAEMERIDEEREKNMELLPEIGMDGGFGNDENQNNGNATNDKQNSASNSKGDE